MSSIEQIQQQSIQTYIKNLKYFEKNHPKLFEKMSLFDIAINEGRYQEKYTLEYKEDGYFDVKINSTGEYLYGEDSIHYSKNLTKQITKSKESRVIEGFYRHYFTKTDVEIAKTQDPTENVESCVLPIIDFVERYIKDKKYLRHIKKFVFFGVGLGFHLNMIDAGIKEPAIYLVIEDDIELFRLSLFTTDYEKFAQNNNIFFSVIDTLPDFRKNFDDFFDMGFLHNSYLKYLMFFDSYQKKFNDIQTFIVGQSHMGYTYDRLLKKYILSLKPIKENYRFLNISQHFKNTVFEKKPVLFLAAGPSLEKNINWIKKNKDRYIILSVFMILPILQKEGIEPDVILHIDEQYEPIQRVLSKVNLNTYALNSFFIFAPGIDIDLFKSYNIKNRSFMLEDRTHYKLNHGALQASSVGETGYALSLIFNSKEIYLLGLDLAFDPESGKSHASGHGTSMKLDKESENISLRETFLKVKGNFRDEVTTNPLFQDSILDTYEITKAFKKQTQQVYNLSDGAYLEDIEPLKIEDIKHQQTIDKKQLKKDIKDALFNYSSTITKEELELFHKRYKRILDKKLYLKKYLKQKIKNPEKFINTFIEFSIDMSINKDTKTSQVEQILSVYLHYVGIYIAEFCNTAGVKYDQKIFKEFQKVIVEQLDRIISKYQKAIEEII